MAQDQARGAAVDPTTPAPAGTDTVSPARVVVILAALLVLAIVVFLVARPKDSSTSAKDSVVPILTTTSTTVVSTDDPTTAAALTWLADDFPAGWTSAPHEPSTGGSGGSGGDVAACAGAANLQPAPVQIHASDFTYGELNAAMDVDFQPDAATVTSDFAVVSTPLMLDCVKAAIIQRLGAKATYPGVVVDVVNLSPPAQRPVMSVAYRLQVRQYNRVIVVVDVFLLGLGRAELSLIFAGNAGTFPQQLEDDVVRKTSARLLAHPT